MIALPWQQRVLRGVARPGVRTAALSVGRSNGKTFLAAALAVDYLLSDRRDSECLIVASSYTQAKTLYRYALKMVEERGHDITDRGGWWYRDSVSTALLRSRETGMAIRALGCDPRRAHGRVYGLALLDEPSQWPPGTSDAMLSAIETGIGKVEGGRIIAIGTRPDNPEHWFGEWLAGGADYCQVHAARPTDPPFRVTTLRRANPSFDHLPALRADLLRQRDAAKTDDRALARYRALALNQGTKDTMTNTLATAEEWKEVEVAEPPPAGGAYTMGIDLGGTQAMSAAAAYWPTGRLEALAVFGGIPTLLARQQADSAGTRYTRMYSRGELLVQEERRVPDVGRFLQACMDRWGRPSRIVADRWREGELRDALQAVGLARVRVVLRGQGFRDGGQDVREFRRALLEGEIRTPPSLLLAAAVADARLAGPDPAGNLKLSKGVEGGRRARARDDTAAAAILAVAEGARQLRKPARAPYVGGEVIR